MQDIFERMQRIIADQFVVEPEEITENTSFEEDLGADSVDLVDLVSGAGPIGIMAATRRTKCRCG